MTRTLQKQLLTWYTKHKRDLPWRKTRDPYKIWISEMMLQQTQVSTALPYYRRFLKAFPTLQSLAGAPEEKVLKLWEGLGYYARARNLRKACRLIVQKHRGRIPADAAQLADLPGVGPYTTGAILSIAFQKQAPLVDGNVSRVLSRIYGIRRDPGTPDAKHQLWELARTLVPAKKPGDFNQALMELGATVCTRHNPRCLSCPVTRHCTARRLGLEEIIPLPAKRAPVKKQHAGVAIIRKKDHILMRKRASRGLLGGLWEFPQFINGKRNIRENLEKSLWEELGVRAYADRLKTTVRHQFTHIDLQMYCYECVCTKGSGAPGKHRFKWIRTKELSRIPLSRAHQKIAQTLNLS